MKQFRCEKCRQLQFKWILKGDKIVIEVKCYACNTFNYFNIYLSSLLKGNIRKNYEKNNEQISQKDDIPSTRHNN